MRLTKPRFLSGVSRLSILLILCTVQAGEQSNDEIQTLRTGFQFVDLTRGAQRTTESAVITQTIVDQVLIRVGGRRTEGGSELGNGSTLR